MSLSTDEIAALGAFLSGLGSILGGIVAIKIAQRRSDQACDRRIEQLHAEYDRGFERAQHLKEP